MEALADVFNPIIYMLLAIIVLSAIIEAILEFIVVPAVKAFAPKLPKPIRALVYKFVGMVLGLLLSYAFGLDLLGVILERLEIVPPAPALAYALSITFIGVLMARGANWWHDFGQKILDLDGKGPELPEWGGRAIPEEDWEVPTEVPGPGS